MKQPVQKQRGQLHSLEASTVPALLEGVPLDSVAGVPVHKAGRPTSSGGEGAALLPNVAEAPCCINSDELPEGHLAAACSHAPAGVGGGAPAPSLWSLWLAALLCIWQPLVAIFAVYAVTLAIFPGFLSEDVHSAALGSWYPVLLFLVFNVADCTARYVPVATQYCLAGSLARCAPCPCRLSLCLGSSAMQFAIFRAVCASREVCLWPGFR
jgi:hypothetical protein